MWSVVAQRPFELLKETLVSLPVMAYPNYLVQFEVYCDASLVEVCTLLPQGGNPIAYASRIWNSAERNYSITKRMCFEAIRALNKICCYFSEVVGESGHGSFSIDEVNEW